MASEESAGLEPITAEPPPVGWLATLGVAFTDVTFVHWRYDPELIAPLLPARLVPDTFDGAAYVGLVPFLMRARDTDVLRYDSAAHLRWSAGADRPSSTPAGYAHGRVRWP